MFCLAAGSNGQTVNDSGSQKVHHNLDVISHKIEAILKTRIDVSTNSTDLEWAPGARSIGDEFVKTSILPISSYKGVKILLFTFTVHLLGPGVREM